MTPFCALCGSTNLADLGPMIGICLDATACHQRQYARLRERAEAAEAELAEVRQTITTFLKVRGGGQGAQDLAEGIRQVLDRGEISSEKGFAVDVGRPSAADRAMVARATGGGIRSREVQPAFDDKEADHA